MSGEQGFDVLRVLVPIKTSVQGYVIHIIQGTLASRSLIEQLGQTEPGMAIVHRSTRIKRQNIHRAERD